MPHHYSQHAKDFYISQWVYDTQLRLEGATRELPDPSIQENLERDKASLLSLLCPRGSALESILNNGTAPLVVRTLASARKLSKSFDMYLNSVSPTCTYKYYIYIAKI